MTDQDRNQYPCLFDPYHPSEFLSGVERLYQPGSERCKHIIKAPQRLSEVEFYALMDSNCYRDQRPCIKGEDQYLHLLAQWEGRISRSSTRYRMVTCVLRSLEGNVLSFPDGYRAGLHSVLDLTNNPILLYPDYPKVQTSVCDNKSARVEKRGEAALRRIPVQIRVQVWKASEYPDGTASEQTMVVKVAVPPAEQAPAPQGAVGSDEEATPGGAQDAPGPVEVFVSYAREDETMMQGLLKHLAGLKSEGLITAWHNRDLTGGAEWETESTENLKKSRIILLLVSPSFLASDFIQAKELAAALERHRQGEARVIPVLIKPVDLSGEGPLAKLQLIPRDARPITQHRSNDAGFVEVSQELRKVVAELRGEPPHIQRDALGPMAGVEGRFKADQG